MRILIIDQYYPAFLKNFYTKQPKVKDYPYQKQQKALFDEAFGTADFYSHALNNLGNPTIDVVINNEFLQKKYQTKQPQSLSLPSKVADILLTKLPLVASRFSKNWELQILEQQIKDFKPDVLYSHNIGYISPAFLQKMKSQVKLIVGQIACPLPILRNFKPYDLIITSFPHFIKKFADRGIKAEYLPLCFEPRMLERVGEPLRVYDVTFMGGISRAHTKGFRLLNELADKIRLDVWGYGKDELDKNSNLYKYHHGEAWGIDMYTVLAQSKMTINRHIDVAENYANNMRLYEATGMGALLLTDKKKNLKELFKIGEEVIDYSNLEDLMKKITYYTSHESERKKIAQKGQKRTLTDHTYQVRMQQLLKVLEQYI